MKRVHYELRRFGEPAKTFGSVEEARASLVDVPMRTIIFGGFHLARVTKQELPIRAPKKRGGK